MRQVNFKKSVCLLGAIMMSAVVLAAPPAKVTTPRATAQTQISTNSNFSVILTENGINGFLTALQPLNGQKMVDLFNGKQNMTYSLNNMSVQIVTGKMKFVGQIKLNTSVTSMNSTFSGDVVPTYDAKTNSINLNVTNINASDPTALSLLQTLQAIGVFNFQYVMKSVDQNYNLSQIGSTAQISSKFQMTSIVLEPGKMTCNGNMIFTRQQ